MTFRGQGMNIPGAMPAGMPAGIRGTLLWECVELV